MKFFKLTILFILQYHGDNMVPFEEMKVTLFILRNKNVSEIFIVALCCLKNLINRR